MDQRDLLEKKQELEAELKKIDEELLKEAASPKKHENDSKPLIPKTMVGRVSKLFKAGWLILNCREYVQNPSKFPEINSSQLEQTISTLKQPTKKELENACNWDLDIDPSSLSKDLISLKNFLPKINLDQADRNDVIREALQHLILRAEDYWEEHGDFLEFEAEPSPLGFEIRELITEAHKESELKSIPLSKLHNVYLISAFSEIEDKIDFNWKRFYQVCRQLPFQASYVLYLVETNPAIWKKRRDNSFRSSILQQLSQDGDIVIKIPGLKDTNLSDLQKRILKAFIEYGKGNYLDYKDAYAKAEGYKNYKTMNEDEDRDYVDQDDIKISGKFRKRDKDKKAVLNYLVKPSGPKSAKFASRI